MTDGMLGGKERDTRGDCLEDESRNHEGSVPIMRRGRKA